MSFHHFDPTLFERWKRDLVRAIGPAYAEHDHTIRMAVQEFDSFHSGKSGYVAPPWELIKAVVWIESGGPRNPSWKVKPMQIGVPGDSGIVDVCTHQNMSLIASPEMRRKFNITAIRSSPALNIQAGLALLHLKLASVMTRRPDWKADLNWMTSLTPSRQSFDETPSTSRMPNQPEPSSNRRYICGWTPFCPVSIYQRYNVGDGSYSRKLEYCLELMRSGA